MRKAFYLRIRKRPTVRLAEKNKADADGFVRAFFSAKKIDADRTDGPAIKVQR